MSSTTITAPPATSGTVGTGTLTIINADHWIDAFAQPPPASDWIIENAFETGDRVLLVAKTKCRKSYFALQLAICTATGTDFLGMKVPKPRKVLFVSLENTAVWEQRRLLGISGALGVASFGGNLNILPLRDNPQTVTAIGEEALRVGAAVVIIDPTYQLKDAGEENDQKERGDLMRAIGSLNRQGLAVVIVSHDTKGESGDRDTRDRGSGSNVLNRAVDCTFALTPYRGDHACKNDLAVMEVLPRNAKEHDPVTIRWGYGGRFGVESAIAPVKATSRNKPARPPVSEKAMDGFIERYTVPVSATEFKDKLKDELGMSKTVAESTYKQLVKDGVLVTWKAGDRNKQLVGTPAMKAAWQTSQTSQT